MLPVLRRVWAPRGQRPLLDELLATHALATRDALQAVLGARCRTLVADRPRLRAHTRFHWWPTEPPPAYAQ